jgi:3-hydroxy acid dehydrogenase/malonic semialdehyde reductase
VRVCVKQLDVSKPEEVGAMVEGLPQEFREIDVLVNNAWVASINTKILILRQASGFMSGVEQAPNIPNDVIRDVWATNVTGVINMTQAVLPIFQKRSGGGKGDVIFMGSVAGRDPYVGGAVSEMSSKYATEGILNECRFTARAKQRFELLATRNTRIRIMTVDPGQVLTVRQPHIVVVGSNRKFCRSSTTSDIVSIKRKQTKSTRK